MRQRPAGSGASLDEAIRPLIVIAGRQLDLRAYRNLAPDPGGEPRPAFLGTDPFEASTGMQVRYEIEDGHTVVQVATRLGPPPRGLPVPVPEAAAEIELAGVHQLSAGDFILT